MSERLKGMVQIAYRVNLGNYQHVEVGSSKEFWIEDSTVIDQLKMLDSMVLDWLDERGIKPAIILTPKK